MAGRGPDGFVWGRITSVILDNNESVTMISKWDHQGLWDDSVGKGT